MVLVLAAHVRVEMLSSICREEGEQQAIMRAIELPPRESINNFVSLESR